MATKDFPQLVVSITKKSGDEMPEVVVTQRSWKNGSPAAFNGELDFHARL
jgi:hypothetical protein